MWLTRMGLRKEPHFYVYVYPLFYMLCFFADALSIGSTEPQNLNYS